ncbi:MAG: ABC transporter permease [Rectinemataceae bacterium]|nr:ABC transporter permease [Rectinemataceae bacterium]
MSKAEATAMPKGKASDFLGKWASLIALVAVFAFFALRMPKMFLTSSNMITILRSISITTIIGIGLTITLAVGGFDLSSGSMASMAGSLVISFIVWYQMSMWLAIPLALVLTMGLMMITMLLIVKFKIPDLLATLAMMFMLDGLSLTYSGGGALSEGMPRPNGADTLGKISQTFKNMGQAPTIIIIMIVIVVVVHIFLTYTKYGRYIYAVGGNKEAARLSGIPIYRYRVYAGLLAAAFIGLGGVLVASRNMSAQIQGAAGYAMPAISAVFIGRSVAGAGKPNAFGTFVGASLVGILENGLIMMSVPYYSLNAVKGVVLALALASTYYSSTSDN